MDFVDWCPVALCLFSDTSEIGINSNLVSKFNPSFSDPPVNHRQSTKHKQVFDVDSTRKQKTKMMMTDAGIRRVAK